MGDTIARTGGPHWYGTRGTGPPAACAEGVALVLVTITIWDLWKVVAALWGARMLLRCIAWVVTPASDDWRAAAWRCQWEILGFLAGAVVGAATLHLSLLPGPEPDRLWPLALLLIGLRATLDLPPLFRACRVGIVAPLRAHLRWRSFMLRLWRRKLAQHGLRYALTIAPRSLFARRAGRD